jgi:ketosteroid isomerase-like protein
MNVRSLFVFSTFLLFASVAYAAGSYQRTKDGKALVWTDSPRRGEEATWSGRRDKNGFATGSGTLTWSKVEPIIVTGSNIPNSRRYAVVVSRYSGKMVRGKFEGAVTYVDASGKRLQATFVKGRSKRPVTQQTAAGTPERSPAPGKPTPTPAPQESPSPAAPETPTAVPQQMATPTPEPTAVPANPTPTPVLEQSLSPAAPEIPTAVPQQTATLTRKQMATGTLKQQTRQADAKSTIAPIATPRDDSVRSHTASPLALPKPPPTVDAETVASFDTLYHAAVKANDIAIMDRVLADDFVFVTDRGDTLTKADLIKEAREKRTIYEHQEEEEGTQKVRVWRDTAVVTALLRIKGTRDQNPFDYNVWVNQTYVRTATGWQYVFGQAVPWPQPDAK